ncbi:C-type lectin domain family 6 member A-like isoform X2 [Rissa tridactyla]|uniref:C-type lectin domain family 6 member A-like isoform X2 n=1 Tax=Rissa tridactyla TaxID=75485 RepID=UPI0023BAA39D|nr:C-type lectin domain family 6 member A-like isoform X2 [Rissa tridactyla]
MLCSALTASSSGTRLWRGGLQRREEANYKSGCYPAEVTWGERLTIIAGEQGFSQSPSLSLLAFTSAVSPYTEQGWICCPNGWKRFQKSCYYLSTDEMSWAESVQNCTGMGSQLVVINSKAEQGFLTIELQQFPKGTNYYIGLYAQEVGKWQWVDQTPFNEEAAFWRKGEPTNIDYENCTVIHTSSDIYNWNDIRCESHYRICEAAALTDGATLILSSTGR